MERNHAIRKQLEVLLSEEPDVTLEEALQITSHQRNRLSSIQGSSPAVAIGYVPSDSEGGNADDPGPEAFGEDSKQARANRLREAAAIAFHKANADMAVRAGILHRSRVEEEELTVGQRCVYWKPSANKLDPYRWRGPGTVVAVQQAEDRNSSIYRDCAWEQLGSMSSATTTT